MTPAPTLAFVFFHAPGPPTAPSEYERSLTEFHRSLAAHPVPGFVASASYRIARLPWTGTALGPVVYEDWYVLTDWAALGQLEHGAIRPPHAGAHDAVAGISGHGVGGVFALRRGGLELGAPRFDRWVEKPRGVGVDARLDGLGVPGGGTDSAWQRRLALGPTPELCLRSAAAPPPGAEGLVVEVRPVVSVRP